MDYVENGYDVIRNCLMNMHTAYDCDGNEWMAAVKSIYDDGMVENGYGGWGYNLYIIQTSGDNSSTLSKACTFSWTVTIEYSNYRTYTG